jgi:hypothetical protein
VQKRTFELEGEVVREMAALVIPPQQEDARWVPDFQSPQVEHALGETQSVTLAA